MSIAHNRKAFFNYEILEKAEAGIVLQGNEVKSIRNGHVNISEAYISIKAGEAWIHNLNIQPYDKSAKFAAEPTRDRKLLLKRSEINRLMGKAQEKSLTIVPLNLFFRRQFVKLELGLGKGKRIVDKRDSIKAKTLNREIARDFKGVVR
jgi:SsrA-binding protein